MAASWLEPILDADGKIDPSKLSPEVRKMLFGKVEREYPTATDAEKYRLLQAATLSYQSEHRPLEAISHNWIADLWRRWRRRFL